MERPWYETRLVRLHLDMHTPEWYPGVFDALDIGDLVKTYRDAGIEAVTFGAKGCYGNCYFDTRTGHPHAQLGGRDFLGELLEQAHQADIKVMAYYLACWDSFVAAQYPDWQVRSPEGKTGAPTLQVWEYLCPNSPYREYMLRQTEEVLTRYPLDGWMYDMVMTGMIGGPAQHCYCEYCQRKFRAQFGRPIPVAEGEDPLWWEFVQWRYQCLEQFLREAHALVKKIRPECAFTFNHLIPYMPYDVGNRAEEPTQYVDFEMAEAYSQVWGITTPSLLPRCSRAFTGGKPVHTFSYRFVDMWDFETKAPMHQAYELYTAVANGSSVCYIDQWYPGGTHEKSAYAEVKPLFDEIKARQSVVVGASPITYAGLLHSQKARDLYAKNISSKYLNAVVGVDKMMTELQQNCEIVPDGQITRESLERFAVVLAPNAVSLSEEQAAVLRDYVAGGGGLVASYLTSLWDEGGRAREDFALGDVFGAQFRGIYPYTAPFFWPAHGHPVAAGLHQKPYIARAADAAVIEAVAGAETIATLVAPASERSIQYGKRWYSNCPHMPPARRTATPFIVANKFGKGRVVYFCWNIGDAYASYGYPHERRLIASAVKWVTAREPLLQVQGPMTLESTYWRQENRLICHIINPHFQKPCGWTDHSGPPSAHRMGFITAEEDVPVAGVEIVVGTKVKSAHLAPSGQALEMLAEGGGARIKLPPIGLWTTVVLE